MPSTTSCIRSLSPETITTSQPWPGALRQRGDDVVGLVPGKPDRRDPHRLQHLPHQRELRYQVVGRSAAGGLVGVVDLAALRLGFLVEGDRQVGRASLADGAQEHGGEAVDGVGGYA